MISLRTKTRAGLLRLCPPMPSSVPEYMVSTQYMVGECMNQMGLRSVHSEEQDIGNQWSWTQMHLPLREGTAAEELLEILFTHIWKLSLQELTRTQERRLVSVESEPWILKAIGHLQESCKLLELNSCEVLKRGVAQRLDMGSADGVPGLYSQILSPPVMSLRVS